MDPFYLSYESTLRSTGLFPNRGTANCQLYPEDQGSELVETRFVNLERDEVCKISGSAGFIVRVIKNRVILVKYPMSKWTRGKPGFMVFAIPLVLFYFTFMILQQATSLVRNGIHGRINSSKATPAIEFISVAMQLKKKTIQN